MRLLPVELKVYAAVLAGAAGLTVGLAVLGPFQVSGIMGDVPYPTRVGLTATLTLLAVLSGLFPIQVTRLVKVSVTTAAHFAAVLLLGVPLGACAVGAGVIGHHAILWRRGRRTPFDLVLNASIAVIQASIAALAAQFAVSSLPSPAALPAAAAVAALTMHVSNRAFIRLATVLASGSSWPSFWRLYWTSLGRNAWQEVALFLLGFLAALNAPEYPWVLVLVAFPTAAIYFSFRSQQMLLTQTREAVEHLADVVDMRDPYTFGHCQRVADLSARVARQLGLPPDHVDLISSAARVHDIGKIGVPDHVLLKQGGLGPEEWAQMRRHPDIGAELLSRFPEYDEGRELVQDHHERFDGDGYPRHLLRDQAPMGARVIAAADAYDAMTTDRPYRARLTPLQAAEELRRHSGYQWDPHVVEALLAVLEAGRELAPTPAPALAAAAGPLLAPVSARS